LLRLNARYPVLLQTRHPRPVPGNQGRKSFLWSGCWEVLVRDDFGVYYQGVTRSAGFETVLRQVGVPSSNEFKGLEGFLSKPFLWGM
jgi:hypothetical protein